MAGRFGGDGDANASLDAETLRCGNLPCDFDDPTAGEVTLGLGR